MAEGPIDVAAVRRCLARADELAERMRRGEEPGFLEVEELNEALFGHLIVLLGAVEALTPRARIKPLVANAARIGGELLVRPVTNDLLSVLVQASACRLLLALAVGVEAFTDPAPAPVREAARA